MNDVSVDEAIAKGKRMVIYPVRIIWIVGISISFFLLSKQLIPLWVCGVGFLVSLLLSWLYWGYIVTKWRL